MTKTAENEGDLVIPAQFATPQALAFMMRHARGLICLSITTGQVDRLGLPMMAVANEQRHQTAFTVSVDARAGITSGVTARDRAHTISVAINPLSTGADVVTPGHVFPLAARPGGHADPRRPYRKPRSISPPWPACFRPASSAKS